MNGGLTPAAKLGEPFGPGHFTRTLIDPDVGCAAATPIARAGAVEYPDMKEVVILVGMQGAGKTDYCRTALPGHTRVSQDEGPREFRSLQNHFRELLAAGVERIVVDRINHLRRQRQSFADMARPRGYRVRIVYFDVPRSVCEERILQRKGHPTLGADKMAEAIGHYEDVLEKPTADECDELVVLREHS